MMGKYIAEQTIKQIIKQGHHLANATVAVLGMTFKENCPDLRNSRTIDLINELKSYGINVLVHDPIINSAEAWQHHQIELSS